jgi:hypothetical protein
VHDYFEILGLPTNAGASEVRRACARRVRRSHPDFRDPVLLETPGSDAPAVGLVDLRPADVAIDFVDMMSLVDRIQAGFFQSPRTASDDPA